MPAVKYYNPNTAVWEEVSTAGPQGVPGPPGPTGPVGTGAEEVAIADLQPTDPGLELWVDTLSPTPGMALDALSDVDTVTTAPVEGDTLVFTGGLWVPGAGGGGGGALLGDFTPNPTWAIGTHCIATKVDRLVTIEGKLRVAADLTAAPNAPQSIGTFPDEFKPAFEIYGPAIATLAAGGQWIKVWQRGSTLSMVNFSAAPMTFVAASSDGIEFSLTYRSLA